MAANALQAAQLSLLRQQVVERPERDEDAIESGVELKSCHVTADEATTLCDFYGFGPPFGLGLGQHRFREFEADDLVTGPRQLPGHSAGAGTQIQDRTRHAATARDVEFRI
jgi:hypothetical protein